MEINTIVTVVRQGTVCTLKVLNIDSKTNKQKTWNFSFFIPHIYSYMLIKGIITKKNLIQLIKSIKLET